MKVANTLDKEGEAYSKEDALMKLNHKENDINVEKNRVSGWRNNTV